MKSYNITPISISGLTYSNVILLSEGKISVGGTTSEFTQVYSLQISQALKADYIKSGKNIKNINDVVAVTVTDISQIFPDATIAKVIEDINTKNGVTASVVA